MTKFEKKLGQTRPRRLRRTLLVEHDFETAIDRSIMTLDKVRGAITKFDDQAPLHYEVMLLRALITASHADDESRQWS